MWGAWSEGVLSRDKKELNRKNQNFFGKIFVLDNYAIFLEKEKKSGKKWIKKRIMNRSKKPVIAVRIGFGNFSVNIIN